MKTVKGVFFDVYVVGSEARLWLLAEDGRRLLLRQPFRPRVYLHGEKSALAPLLNVLERRKLVSSIRETEKIEFWSGETIPVLELEIPGAGEYKALSLMLPEYDGPVQIFNADLALDQYFLYTAGLFPCGAMEAEVEGETFRAAAMRESPWDDFELPGLSVLRLGAVEGRGPKGRLPGIKISWEGREYGIEGEARDIVRELNRHLARADPDLILTEDGDTYLFPWLLRLEGAAGMKLNLDRDPAPPHRELRTEGRSYFSYGRILYSPPRYPLYGRWHVDAGASFMHGEADLEGVVEMARVAKLPVQLASRTSPGTAISSMQLDRAIQDGILVPWRKGEPEHFKRPWTLFLADKGGLTYTPPVGVFEKVAEIDFASMYPAIMVAHNVSPETILCPCCALDGPRVPEIGYHICQRRRGLVPRTLEPLLARRLRWKALKKSAATPQERVRYDRRQTALKWMLVTCFGYLGYRNARFGKIEAHEAVTAYGRETLLAAKEVAEARGYRMLHALTDSMWLDGGDVSSEALGGLAEEISQATGIGMAVEGTYRWIVFPPSRQHEGVGVPNRYFGAFTDGTLKARGIMARRRDTPAFIKEAQRAMIDVLIPARNLGEFRALLPKAQAEAGRWREELMGGNVPLHKLVLSRQLTQEIDHYRVENWTSLAARQLQSAGEAPQVGERFGVVVRDRRDKLKEARVRPAALLQPEDGYDAELYGEILERAVEEI